MSDETYVNFGKNDINKRINSNSNQYNKHASNLVQSNSGYSKKANFINNSNYSSQFTKYTQKDIDAMIKSNDFSKFDFKTSLESSKSRDFNSSDSYERRQTEFNKTKDVSIIDSFSDEQKKVYNAALSGENVFFTGWYFVCFLNNSLFSAGTGKSFVLKAIINALPANSLAITASTGIAALNIGGLTLHSWSGIGLGTNTAKILSSIVLKNPKAKDRWDSCKVLIIDEVSMLDGILFDKLEQIARIIKRNEKPFGGLQIILCGDFLQLPPVKAELMCFESETFKKCLPNCILLRSVFRQNDDVFVKVYSSLILFLFLGFASIKMW